MKKIKIAVNTRLLLSGKLEGIGWFTYETLKRITKNNPEVDFHFFFDRKFSNEFIFNDNVIGHAIFPPTRHPLLYDIWFDYSVARKLKKGNYDLFLSTDGYLSRKTSTPQLPVIHDLNFEHHPEDLPKKFTRYYTKRFPEFARIGKRIITVSEYSKRDISETYGIDKNLIDVCHNGVNSKFKGKSEEVNLTTRDQYSKGNEYFVYVGSLHKRKNIDRLLMAFDEFKSQRKGTTKLLIVGAAMWNSEDLDSSFHKMKFKDEVIFTGRLYDEELNRIISASIAMCFVPYFEGFGIPILEGFKCQTPVITSNVTSMPEVAQEAALLVNPFKVSEITEAMIRLFDSPDLRNEMIKKGDQRVQDFSWDKTAKGVWKSIQKALAE